MQAWKGMLDAEGFVTAGWEHELHVHIFDTHGTSEARYLLKGKVRFILFFDLLLQSVGKALSTNISYILHFFHESLLRRMEQCWLVIAHVWLGK